MAETDCPYVAPKPYRGKRNEPVYVMEIVKKIAELRGGDFETIRSALVENAFRTFALNK
jgi:TatD DNase family protein